MFDLEFSKVADLLDEVDIGLVGGDVVEIAPQYDAATNTVQAGAQMLFEILSLMTLNDNWLGGE